MRSLGIELLTVSALPPVEFVNLAADVGCRYISTGLTAAPYNPHGYPSFSLRDDAGLRNQMISAMDDRDVSISLGEGCLVRAGADVRDLATDLDRFAELGVPRINTVSLDPDLGRSLDQFGALVELAAARGMSAVPSRRAGAGSAMNDASRELGAALGIAVMGSIAASQFTNRVESLTRGLSPALQGRASASIAGAIAVADSLGGKAGAALHVGADNAFLEGMHLSVTIGAVLCIISAWLVTRYLPSVLSHEGAMHGPVEAMEDVAQLGIAGVPPIFADERFPGDDVPDVVDGVPTSRSGG